MEQNKTKMEAMLRSILDEILESKLTAILSSISEAKLKVYEESMTFFNTSFETRKVKMDSLEKQRRLELKKTNAWEVILRKWIKRLAIYVHLAASIVQ